ncbi:hypothetical protein JF550_05080 [Microbacterium esteraromaticum]|uniref:Uncharacterized protein n=1 Tax=Microbacterium esteraromaticum TaxID=57043 RepID=A0A939IR33_9MICO|nr:hypothetical protein [Microbacterium esteraromaticum]MBN8205325.1 hypothetical protein [Microbacterium esteraromaticum]MBN8415479.1 hypothetical protein [Microbacterium esteraromaticum]MBN8424168.1 hypothetical protein [Microbacterium esteraromaticum]MCA1305474.1 hypothetical protein [Microbacterium esteraromaticum]
MSETEQNGISRRTVTKAMAWAVPAVAVASTVPTAAASCIPTISLGPGSCKCPGQSTNSPWYYFLRVCAGGTACPIGSLTITITKVVSNSGITIWQGSEQVGVDGCVIIQGSSSNSANFLDIYYSIDGDAQSPTRVNAPPDCDKTPDPIGRCAR